jgi:hypothetical protein
MSILSLDDDLDVPTGNLMLISKEKKGVSVSREAARMSQLILATADRDKYVCVRECMCQLIIIFIQLPMYTYVHVNIPVLSSHACTTSFVHHPHHTHTHTILYHTTHAPAGTARRSICST